MRVLLVEPDYLRRRRAAPLSDVPRREDEGLWYPPLGLLKIGHFHRARGDEVCFVRGCDPSVISSPTLFAPSARWDRVYVCTLFTYDWDETIRTINFYKEAVGGTLARIFVGGVMASLMPSDVHAATGIFPTVGVLHSPQQLGLDGDEDIDALPPDYDLLDARRYAINRTYYAHTTRGCPRKCGYCGVRRVEPDYVSYIDIKPQILHLREKFGDKPFLRLMDNNILASDRLEDIVRDLVELGYGRGQRTSEIRGRRRVIDFNQGLDALFLSESAMRALSQLEIEPMRFAFDHDAQKKGYMAAIELARRYGVKKFSSYLLFNWNDTPRDLYQRLLVNIDLNKSWGRGSVKDPAAEIYSYPMRYAPIDDHSGPLAHRVRDHVQTGTECPADPIRDARWTPRFLRNLEVIKAAAHGAISPTPGLALRALGHTYEEFIANLYMPEVLIRNRNRYERHVYPHEPPRVPGTGAVEEFRTFVLQLAAEGGDRFYEFHNAVSPNTREAARGHFERTTDEELRRWLVLYLG